MAVTQPTLGGSALPWPQQDGGYPALMDAGGRLTRVGQLFSEIQAEP